MSSRAVRQFRARNPNQHQLLTGLVVDRQMSLLERGAKPYMRGASPGIVEDGEGEERGRARRRTRGGKTVTWSKTLLQVSPNSHNKRDIVNWFLHQHHYGTSITFLSVQALLVHRFAASALVHLDKQPRLVQHLDLLHLGCLHLDWIHHQPGHRRRPPQ